MNGNPSERVSSPWGAILHTAETHLPTGYCPMRAEVSLFLGAEYPTEATLAILEIPDGRKQMLPAEIRPVHR